MVIWLRQLCALLGELTDLVFTSSVPELSVLSKLNFPQLITEHSAYLSAEIQTYRNTDQAKHLHLKTLGIQSLFLQQKIKSSQVLWAFKRAYKIREYVDILAINLSLPHFLLVAWFLGNYIASLQSQSSASFILRKKYI